jgi:hypothetical protein
MNGDVLLLFSITKKIKHLNFAQQTNIFFISTTGREDGRLFGSFVISPLWRCECRRCQLCCNFAAPVDSLDEVPRVVHPYPIREHIGAR